MATSLNLTIPLKQDPQTQESLKQLIDSFTQKAQPTIDTALSQSQIVHFARIVVIDNKYLQILTEFDGDLITYAEFFRKKLGPIFQEIFSLAEDAPPWEDLNNPDSFYKYAHTHNTTPLGGYLFSAVGNKTVREIRAAFGQNGSAPERPTPAQA
ncbi:MAG: hypothetical protein ACRDRW_02665 [Pseudonocardiaceae bacterium]